ncbi:MAG: substrate-binding domain-containing protein [Bryobacter sp.]|nr:substrate-binding domain-containing protein [Bryobacter sp.]
MRFLVCCLLLLSACSRSEKPIIGVIPKGASHQFWLTVRAGALQAGEDYGYQIEWNAPALEIDRARQIDITQAMITRRLAGIAIAPVDRVALRQVIERAADASIPVAVYDSDVDTPKRLCYIATNNREGGRIAARRLGERLKGRGEVGIISFMPGSASTQERTEGFLEEMRAKFPTIEVLPVQYGMANRAKAMAVTENLLTAHPNLAGLFADNESSSAGAVQALHSRNRKNLPLVAFDASEHLVQELRSGFIDSLIVQDPFRMGYESVKAIALHRRGEACSRRQDLPARLLLPSDLAKPDVQALLFPDLSRWPQP